MSDHRDEETPGMHQTIKSERSPSPSKEYVAGSPASAHSHVTRPTDARSTWSTTTLQTTQSQAKDHRPHFEQLIDPSGIGKSIATGSMSPLLDKAPTRQRVKNEQPSATQMDSSPKQRTSDQPANSTFQPHISSVGFPKAMPPARPSSSDNDFDFQFKAIQESDNVTERMVQVSRTFTIVPDLDDTLEELGRLTRMGNFRAAKRLVALELEERILNPRVFILYAELLLEVGCFEAITKLKDLGERVIPSSFRSPIIEDSESADIDKRYMNELYLNWKAILLIAWRMNKHESSTIWYDVAQPWLSCLTSGLDFESTQV